MGLCSAFREAYLGEEVQGGMEGGGGVMMMMMGV
jgi:hypothetical protein